MNNEIIAKSLKFVIDCLILTINSQDFSFLPNDEKEKVINVTFNVLTNTLKPEYAIIFNDVLFSMIGKMDLVNSFKVIDQITKNNFGDICFN